MARYTAYIGESEWFPVHADSDQEALEKARKQDARVTHVELEAADKA